MNLVKSKDVLECMGTDSCSQLTAQSFGIALLKIFDLRCETLIQRFLVIVLNSKLSTCTCHTTFIGFMDPGTSFSDSER